MPSKKITWTDILMRQHEMTIPQDSKALVHLLGALDNMCDDQDHEITPDRILNAVKRAFDFAAPELPLAGRYVDADATLSPQQRREISDGLAAAIREVEGETER
jgi:hypothetical protein